MHHKWQEDEDISTSVPSENNTTEILCYILLGLDGIVFLCLTYLCLFHIYINIKGLTTLEYQRLIDNRKLEAQNRP